MTDKHTAAEIAAFMKGLADRKIGRPIMAFGDERDEDGALTDAYMCGYDPRDELAMVKPEFAAQAAASVTQFCAETGSTIPTVLPRNGCEFSS